MHIFTKSLAVCVSTFTLYGCSLINKFDEVKVRNQDDTGKDDGGAGDASLEQKLCSGVVAGSSDCEQCTAGACCPALQACVWNPDCANLLACLQACSAADGGDACATKCLDAHPGSVPTLESLVVCQQANCQTACPADPEKDAGPDVTTDAGDAADDASDAGDEETGDDAADGGSEAGDEEIGNDAADEMPDDVTDVQNSVE